MAPKSARTSSSNSSSSIKGGGRAALTNELGDAIVDYLRFTRQSKNPLLRREGSKEEDITPQSESDHEAKHRRSKFLKNLVQHHERHTLSVKLNNVSLTEERTGIKQRKVPKESKEAASKNMSNSKRGGGSNNKSKKVRLDLVEAVHKDRNNPTKWKVGSTRKTVVLERSLTIEELLTQAQGKLNMKKRAVRCFFVDQKVEIDLQTNLQGLEDGSVVYVSTTTTVAAEARQTRKKDDEKGEDELSEYAVEDLELVKKVYAGRALRFRQPVIDKPIQFADYFEHLAPFPEERLVLPACSYRKEILRAVDRSRVVIVCGATGCGKSTQCPQFLLEGMLAAGRLAHTNIVVTQPRRVAAMALAERVASETKSPAPGNANSIVGYHVRLDKTTSSSTRITYCTVGILLRKLTSPSLEDMPPLADVSHLVIDEVHERDINTDFCLTILRRVLVQNANLKIILMSATNTPDLFVNYFSSIKYGIEPLVLDIPGRMFPVANIWLNEIETLVGGRVKEWSEHVPPEKGDLSPRATGPIDNVFLAKLVAHLASKTDAGSSHEKGAILVFLPGRGEIESLRRTLEKDDVLNDCCNICVLHSGVSKSKQRLAFEKAPADRTKVVLSTNVAETSITIADVSYVIDSGRVKESRFNSESRIKELVTVWISQASATQRSGRAGRVRDGTCFRFYTETFYQKNMVERTTPEILRTPLDELVLQACLLDEDQRDAIKRKQSQLKSHREGTIPVHFLGKTPEPPSDESLENASQHLIEIGALKRLSNEDEVLCVKMTPLGYHLSQLPMDTKIGKVLIVGSILGCIESSLTAAAALSSSKPVFWQTKHDMQKELIRDGFGGAFYEGGTVKGDTIAVIAAYNTWSATTRNRYELAKDYGLDYTVLQDIRNLREQYRSCMMDAGFIQSSPSNASLHESALLTSCCLVAGLYPNVASLARPNKGKFGFKGGRLVTKDGDSCKPASYSFQSERVQKVTETGRDLYAVYHSKHRIIGAAKDTSSKVPTRKQVFLSEVNFVSRFTLLLFGGDLTIKDNFVLVDEWLKFKIGDNGRSSAILFAELRREMDNVLLSQLQCNSDKDSASTENRNDLIDLVLKLLQEE